MKTAHFFRARDGRLCEHWGIRDELDVLYQVGALDAGRHQPRLARNQTEHHVGSDRRDAVEPPALRVRDRQHADVVDGSDRPAQQDRSHIRQNPVDHPGPQEGTGQRGPTLEQHIGAIRQRLDHFVRIAGANHHCARVVVQHLCFRRDFALTDDDPQRLALGEGTVGQPRGQQRVIGEHRAGADNDRVGGATATVHVGPCSLAGDPLAAAVRGRTAAVDAGGEFPCDMR